MRAGAAIALLLLAGCGGGAAGWSKPGADQGAAASAYRECRDAVDAAVGTQADIDQDIAATRGADAQRSEVVRMQTRAAGENTRQRAARLMASCMTAHGFTPAK